MTPPSISNLFLYNNRENKRFVRSPERLIYTPLKNKMHDTNLYWGLPYYNRIPESIKVMQLKKNKNKNILKTLCT